MSRKQITETYVTVNENRAPTDESIRLAKEYREKAWEESPVRF